MENFIYCYLAAAYLVMIGYAIAVREYDEYSLKNKEEAAVLGLIVFLRRSYCHLLLAAYCINY